LFLMYIYLFALLKTENQNKSAIRQAVHGARVRFRPSCNEMELHLEDTEKTLGGISNEKDISGISHFNFLIHFFVPLSK
jgi:hypothetical protein